MVDVRLKFDSNINFVSFSLEQIASYFLLD